MTRQPRKSARLSVWRRIFLLGLALILFLLESAGLVELGLSPTPSPPDEGSAESPGSGEDDEGAVQVYFSTPWLQDKKAGIQGSLDERVATDIERARVSVDVAAYELDLESVTQALLSAHRRGVQVRLVIDSHSADEPAVQRLQGVGVPVVPDQGEALMHHKFIVLDGEVVWTGSWNLTANDTDRNNNNLVRIVSSMLAENYTTEFEEMFIRRAFGPDSLPDTPYPHVIVSDSAGGEIELASYFAPEDQVADQIIALLEEARSSIRFMAFSFTDDRIGRVLVEKARSGLIVQGVFEKRNSGTPYCEYHRLHRAGLDVLTDANPYMMHHKVFILDDQVVVTGSYNFTRNAALANDENLLVIRDPAIAAEYRAEFDRIYGQAAAAAQSSG